MVLTDLCNYFVLVWFSAVVLPFFYLNITYKEKNVQILHAGSINYHKMNKSVYPDTGREVEPQVPPSCSLQHPLVLKGDLCPGVLTFNSIDLFGLFLLTLNT